jgi:alpha-mannosidase
MSAWLTEPQIDLRMTKIAPNLEAGIHRLFGKVWSLSQSVPVIWKQPPQPPRDPLQAAPDATWREVKPGEPLAMQPDKDHWFYADLVFPERKNGIALAGESGTLWLGFWCPFTLWLDGRELFREEHAWRATGPIFEVAIPRIEPGRRYRLVLKLNPVSATPFGYLRPDALLANVMTCIEAGVDLAAVAAELRFALGVCRSTADRKQVERAASRLDLRALEREAWPEFFASARRMESELAVFSERVGAMNIHILGYAHIDLDWMWTWRDTALCARRDFKAVTDLMTDFPELTFGMSQVPLYEEVRRKDPEVFAKVREFIRAGRWENWAGAWVENDLHQPDGESLARQMQYAAQWSREHLGAVSRVQFAPDTFGHPGNLPQLLKLAGQDIYFHSRCNPGGAVASPDWFWRGGNSNGAHDAAANHSRFHRPGWPAWLWRGVDGSETLAVSSHYGGDLVMPEMLGSLLLPPVFEAQRLGLTDSHWVCGYGDHGGGLTRHSLALIERFFARPLLPRHQFGTLAGLSKALLRQRDKLPAYTGGMFEIFEGCYTTHAEMKALNRRSESALLDAETLAALTGLSRNSTLRQAWTGVLFNQFHDILCGAGVSSTYQVALGRSRRAVAVAERVVREATGVAGNRAFTLVNPLGFARTEVVRLVLPKNVTHLAGASGSVNLPVQRLGKEAWVAVPSMDAFAVQALRPRTKRTAAAGDAVAVLEQPERFTIETPFLRCELNKASGTIGSCFDKRDQRELVGYGVPKPILWDNNYRADTALNVFQILDETPHAMSAWHIGSVVREENLLTHAQVEFLGTGPVCAHFRVTHRFRSSRLVEEIFFYRDLPRIEFRLDLDWREKGDARRGVPLLKVAFATAMRRPRFHVEGPFTVTEHPADGQERVTHKWADLTGEDFGFTLFNDSRYGCDALGGRLRLTLVRNAYDPDPDSDCGRHVVRFAFEPHGADFDAGQSVRSGMAFNRPLRASGRLKKIRLIRPPFAWASDAGSVVCSAVKCAEESSGVLVRFWETAGRRCRIRLRCGAAELVDFLERPLGRIQPRNGVMEIVFGPHQIKTVRFNRNK